MNTNTTETFPSIITNRYEIVRLLGEGGMSRVYLAQDKQLPRKVAIKRILSELSDKEEVIKRIEREVQTHASIKTHENIVTLFDKIEESGQTFLIMEYVEGDTLDIRSTQNEFSEAQIISIIADVLNALKAIHACNVIHRDIKPENIIISKNDSGELSAKLMDFGISQDENLSTTATKLTQIEVGTPGSPAYMSPEQIDSKTFGEVGPASDLYAVGIILYELLTKSPPFTGTMTQILTGHLVTVPDVENIHVQQQFLKSVLSKALSKKQQDRYTSAEQFLRELRAQAQPNVYKDKTQLAVKLDTNQASNKTQLHIPPQTKTSSRNVLLPVILVLGMGAAGAGYYFNTFEQEEIAIAKPESKNAESQSDDIQTENKEDESDESNENPVAEVYDSQTELTASDVQQEERVVVISTVDPSTVPSPIDSTATDIRPIDPYNYLGPVPDDSDYSSGTQASDAFKALREKKLQQASSVPTQKTTTKRNTAQKTTTNTSTSKKTTSTAKSSSNKTKNSTSSSSGWSVTGSSSNKVN